MISFWVFFFFFLSFLLLSLGIGSSSASALGILLGSVQGEEAQPVLKHIVLGSRLAGGGRGRGGSAGRELGRGSLGEVPWGCFPPSPALEWATLAQTPVSPLHSFASPHNTVLQAGGLRQLKAIFSQFWRDWKSKIKVSQSRFLQGLSSAGRWLSPESSHSPHFVHVCVLISSYTDIRLGPSILTSFTFITS